MRSCARPAQSGKSFLLTISVMDLMARCPSSWTWPTFSLAMERTSTARERCILCRRLGAQHSFKPNQIIVEGPRLISTKLPSLGRFLPEVDVFVAGYPCVSLSTLNNNRQGFEDAESKTGSGYFAAMGFIRQFKPPLVAFENVRTMLQSRQQDGGRRPIDIQNDRMMTYGYDAFYMLCNSCEFGLPQSRNRVWMLYIRKDQLKDTMYQVQHDVQRLGTKCSLKRFWQDLPMPRQRPQRLCGRGSARYCGGPPEPGWSSEAQERQ